MSVEGEGGVPAAWREAMVSALATLQIFATAAPAVAAMSGPRTPTPRVASVTTEMMLAESSVMKDTAAQLGAAGAGATKPSGPFEEAWAKSNIFYYDSTHKGNDWQAVKSRLQADISAGKKSETKATEEMLKLLGDKYTRLVDPETYEMLSKYDLIGVGVMLSPNSEGQLAVASPPRAKSQAESFGVKKGDVVASINGMDTAKMNSFDVIDFLAKYEGKTLTFEIQGPEPGAEVRKVELDRTFPAVQDPIVYALKDQGQHKVGYVRVREFNSIVTNRLTDALEEMKAGGADEFVLDLRGNGGGAFQSALGIAGLFMENKPITYVVDGSGERAEFKTKTGALVPDAPLVVWVDGMSASASEVLAGALQDDCRAVLRGERTFGKGLVQAVYGLTDGSGLILTVAQYETPRGDYIHGKGILPDIRGGLPLKMLSTNVDFDQGQFDAARERMKSCPPMQQSRVGFVGAAGASSP